MTPSKPLPMMAQQQTPSLYDLIYLFQVGVWFISLIRQGFGRILDFLILFLSF